MISPIHDQLKQLASATQLSDILKNIQEVSKTSQFSETMTWGLSANITIDQLEITLTKHAFLNQKNIKTVAGSYDSHIENIELFKKEKVEYAIFLNFFDAILPSLEARAATIPVNLATELKSKVQNQFQFILKSAPSFKRLFISICHRMTHPESIGLNDPLDNFINDINEMITTLAQSHPNVVLIDLAPIVTIVGRTESFNTRFYYKFKSPYTIPFLDELSRQLFILLRGGGSYFYKALVLDCDNSLWGGIIGEDLMSGIKLGPHEYPDNIFWTIQHEILALKQKGVLLVLCSKNNPEDVDEVLLNHPNCVLRNEDIILKKVNWQDKAENIRQIAKELNIGLDSLVFLDDSEFECNAVRSQLPQVMTIQVPKNTFEYPKVFQKVKELFGSIDQKNDSSDKTEQYRIRALAKQEEANFTIEEDYLASLQLKVKLRKNLASATARISELTQKSNQFNVTTKRYTPQDITAFMSSSDSAVYSLEVSDKFGDSGLTGIAILKYSKDELIVDSFLMSCRVIGRGIEFSIWEKIFQDAVSRGCSKLSAEFIKSPKNILVESFFEKLGCTLVDETNGNKTYKAELNDFPQLSKPYLEVNYES